jgi:3-oxoacyl-[acyl-carrier-protein] synthase II
MASSWQALCEGRSGVGPITHFDASDYDTRIAAELKDFDVTPYMDRKEARRNDPFVRYAMAASKQALADSGLEITEELADDFGVIIGSGIGGLNACHDQFKVLFDRGPDRVSPFYITQFITDIAAGVVSMAVNARGPNFATVSACATGASAIGEASEMIKRGDATVILAGGSECAITPIGIAAFSAIRALSRHNDDPPGASRPFDAERDGFVLTFLQPVDPISAANAQSYKLTTYTYIYQADYGSPEVDQSTPAIKSASLLNGQESLAVATATMSNVGRTMMIWQRDPTAM